MRAPVKAEDVQAAIEPPIIRYPTEFAIRPLVDRSYVEQDQFGYVVITELGKEAAEQQFGTAAIRSVILTQ